MPTLRDVLFLSGDLFLPKSVRTFLEQYWVGNDRSLVYITNWSLIHLVSGILTGYILKTYWPTYGYYWTGFLIHSVWELWQILVKNTPYWTLRGRVDVVMDTVLFMFGMWVYHVIYLSAS
jgi:hypothetical protein